MGNLKEELTIVMSTKSDSDVILSNSYNYKQKYYCMGNPKDELITVVLTKSDSDVILSNIYNYKQPYYCMDGQHQRGTNYCRVTQESQ